MPCYNSAPFIAKAIQSIIDQTYKDWELLVMDDCSTDDTLPIIREIQKTEPRILLHTSEGNMGVAHQMNKGIARAKGGYIGRMDSDDISAPHRIREQLTFLGKYTEPCLCTTDYRVFHSPGSDGIEERVSQIKRVPGDPESIKVGLIRDLPVCGPSFFAHREIFDHFSFEETLVIAEDYDLFCRIAGQYKLFNLEKVLYDYRKHGKSLTDNGANWKGEKIDLIRRAYLERAGIRLEQGQIDFFIDFITARTRHKVDRSFFQELKRIKKIFSENDYFERSSIRSFFRDRLHDYLIATKNYGSFAFVRVLAGHPSVFFRYSIKDSMRIIIRSLNGQATFYLP